MAGIRGLEPPTNRLTADCSTIELCPNVQDTLIDLQIKSLFLALEIVAVCVLLYMVIARRFELRLPPWKGGVLPLDYATILFIGFAVAY